MGRITLDINGKNYFGEKNYVLSIIKCAQEHCHPRKLAEERVMDYYSVHFVIYGSGILKYGDKIIELSQGQSFLLYKGETYEYYPNPLDPWSYIWIDFNGENVESLFAMCGYHKTAPTISIGNFNEFVSSLKQLVEAYDASDMQLMNTSAYFVLILAQLLEAHRKETQSIDSNSIKRRRVRDILMYINNNYRLDMNVESIAREQYISPSYLMALFAEEVGMSPMEYLRWYRIASACELMQKGNNRISEIANMTGFADPLHFSRVFSKIKGMSPREYMKNHAANDSPFAFLTERNIDFR